MGNVFLTHTQARSCLENILHMADAISRVTSAKKLGAFCMQHGPGAENAYGGVAQCFGESIPVLVLRGADSDLLRPEVAEAMRNRGPRAVVVTIPGCGHAPARRG